MGHYKVLCSFALRGPKHHHESFRPPDASLQTLIIPEVILGIFVLFAFVGAPLSQTAQSLGLQPWVCRGKSRDPKNFLEMVDL